MNKYTHEQIEKIVLKVLKEVNTYNVPSLSLEEKKRLADNNNTPVATLEQLADDEKWNIRCSVARNKNISLASLEKLAVDGCWRVRYYVAGNPNTPAATLEKLAYDKKMKVRNAAKQNPNYNPTTTITLTKHQKEAIQRLIDFSQDESLKTIKL